MKGLPLRQAKNRKRVKLGGNLSPNNLHSHNQRHVNTWMQSHITTPLQGIGEHIYENKGTFLVSTISIFCVGYLLREYASPRLTYPATAGGIPENWQKYFVSGNRPVQIIPYDFPAFDNEKGVRLNGWYIPAKNKNKKLPTILFLHGNAGNILHRYDNLLLLHENVDANIFIFDYRGYGNSYNSESPSPSEWGLTNDAISALYFLKNEILSEKNDAKIVVFGRSLGGSVAWKALFKLLGSDNKMDNQILESIEGMIIENSLTSVNEVLGWNFMRLLARDKWDTIKLFKEFFSEKKNKGKIEFLKKLPLFLLSSKYDEILDPKMMKDMRELCEENGMENVKWKLLEDPKWSKHNTAYYSKGYFNAFGDFVDSLAQSKL